MTKRRTHKRKLSGAINERNHTPRSDEWGNCDNCGQHLPICEETGMCYPCTTGDASTINGDL